MTRITPHLRRDPVIYGWQRQALPVGHSRLRVVRARGADLWDDAGRRYVDFAAGQISVNAGYADPRILAAMTAQMAELTYVAPGFSTAPRETLARTMAEILPGKLEHVLFTNSGAEAVENALKIARAATGRHKFLSASQSYHGATAGASGVSGDPRRLLWDPGLPGVAHFHLPIGRRSVFSGPDQDAQALKALEDLIAREGPHLIAGLIIEPIVGTNGLYAPSAAFMAGMQTLCRKHGILLIADETMSGWGRSGAWFACEHYGLAPDILTTSKGLTSGYVPLGATAITGDIYDRFLDQPFVGGLTTEGHALGCATALANIEVYRQDGLIERSAVLGARLLERLRDLMARHSCIGEVRGRGLFACIELDSSSQQAIHVARACQERGLIVLGRGDHVFIGPPLMIPETDLEFGISVLDDVLAMVVA